MGDCVRWHRDVSWSSLIGWFCPKCNTPLPHDFKKGPWVTPDALEQSMTDPNDVFYCVAHKVQDCSACLDSEYHLL